jgi:PBP1b-binding outer membrane lipoprotein LpoB
MKTSIASVLFAAFTLVLFSSCSKETAEPVSTTPQKQVFIRIKQVDKNGNVSYSPKVRVQVKSVM